MADKNDRSTSDTASMVMIGVVVGLTAAAAIFPILVAAVLLLRYVYSRLERNEVYILLAGAVVAAVIGHSAVFTDYFKWMFHAYTGDRAWGSFPIIGITTMAVLVASIWTLIDLTSRVGGRVAPFLRRQYGMKDKSVIPSLRRKQKSSISRPPVERIMTSTAQRDEGEPGKIVLGVDGNGKPVYLSESEVGTHGTILGSTGSGKALALDTPIPTPAGWTTMGDLQTGDQIFDANGQACTVTFATEVQYERDCYEVHFSDGTRIVADAEHRWYTDTIDGVEGAVRTTEEILKSLTYGGHPNHAIAATQPLQTPHDPTITDDLFEFGCTIGQRSTEENTPNNKTNATADPGPAAPPIPGNYLRAGLAQRQQLLEGILTEGSSVDAEGRLAFTTGSKNLAKSVRELMASLGHVPELARIPGGHRWAVTLTHEEEPTGISLTGDATVIRRRRIIDVVEVPSVPVRCIQVDSPDHLFLAGDTMIATHNTETIKTFIGGLLDLGWDVTVVDLKEDTQAGGLRDFCRDYGHAHALPFQQIAISSSDNPYWFNPLHGLTVDEARSAVLALQEFDDAYWAALNQRMLGQLLGLMYYAHEARPDKWEAPDMYRLGRLFSEYPEGGNRCPDMVKNMIKDVLATGGAMTEENFSSVHRPSKPEAQSASGYGSKIINMYETNAGRLALRPSPQRRVLDVTQPGITYVGLNSLGMKDLAKVVSTAVLVRLCAYAGARTTGKAVATRKRCVVIDEANAVDRSQVANLLSRARSAGIAVFLATQGPKDWVDEDRKFDFGTLAQNTNVGIIMKQKDSESAEICAEFLGKSDQITVKKQMSGRWTSMSDGQIQEMEDYKIGPEELRENLDIGEAVVKVFSPVHRLMWVKIPMRDPTWKPGR